MSAATGRTRNRLILFFLFVFLIGLVVNLPARLVLPLLSDQNEWPSDVSVQGLNGTLWQGDTLLAFGLNQNRDVKLELQAGSKDGLSVELRVGWSFSLVQWIQSGYPLIVTIRHPGSDVTAMLRPSGYGVYQAKLDGHLHALLLNPVLAGNNAWIEHGFSLRHVTAEFDHQKLLSMKGAVSWEGGDTYFLSRRKPVLIPYPPLVLRISDQEQGIYASLTTQDSAQPLAVIELNQNGWLSAKALGRLKRVVPALPVPARADDEKLFSYKEKLW